MRFTMRVILLSVGSRGDAEPYCATAKELLQRSAGIQVDMFLQSNLQYLADPYLRYPSFRLFAFPFESADFYKVKGSDGPSHPDPRMKHVETFAKIVGDLVLPCLPQVLKVVDDPEKSQDCVIVTSAFTRSLAFIISRARKIPVILLHLQPLLPNQLFPSYRTSRAGFVQACMNVDCHQTTAADSGKEYEETYWNIEHALEEFFLREKLTRTGCQCFGKDFLPPTWEEFRTILTGNDELISIANAYTNHLVPPLAGSPGLGPHVLDIGPLADGYVQQEVLDQPLQALLDSSIKNDDEKPICIGFGSMPFHDIGVILQAVKALKVRAVLVGETFLRIPESHPAIRYKRIICVSTAAYPLLLPQCSAMICHGGVGVVQACLRAGIPCLISPLMGDQFAFAKLVEGKGYGVQCGSRLSELSVEDIVLAVETGRQCKDSCRALGLKIRQEERPSAVERLVDLVSELVDKKSLPLQAESDIKIYFNI
jgi:hypothetical protein